MTDKKSQTSEDILKGQGQAFGVKAKEDWYGRDLQTNSDPLIDSGTGRPMIIRQFQFVFNPNLKQKPTKQDLFNSHWPQMKIMLWGDGLVANTDVEPRMIVGKRKYRIFLLCEPKLRTMVAERPLTLQQLTQSKK